MSVTQARGAAAGLWLYQRFDKCGVLGYTEENKTIHRRRRI